MKLRNPIWKERRRSSDDSPTIFDQIEEDQWERVICHSLTDGDPIAGDRMWRQEDWAEVMERRGIQLALQWRPDNRDK